MNKSLIKEFLSFRQQFTKRQWMEINHYVDARLKEKADQLELDDSDLELIAKRLSNVIR